MVRRVSSLGRLTYSSANLGECNAQSRSTGSLRQGIRDFIYRHTLETENVAVEKNLDVYYGAKVKTEGTTRRVLSS